MNIIRLGFLFLYVEKMVNEIGVNGEIAKKGQLNTQNEFIAETLDEKKFREYIFENILKKYARIEYSEMFGYQGKTFHFDIPAVGDFKGFNFECFISDEQIKESKYNKELGNNKELKNKLYSYDEIKEFDNEIRKYMEACMVKRYWYGASFSYIISKLYGGDKVFWLKNNVWYHNGAYMSEANQRCKNDPYEYIGHLLLKI